MIVPPVVPFLPLFWGRVATKMGTNLFEFLYWRDKKACEKDSNETKDQTSWENFEPALLVMWSLRGGSHDAVIQALGQKTAKIGGA